MLDVRCWNPTSNVQLLTSRHNRHQFHLIPLPQNHIVGHEFPIDGYQEAFGVNADFSQRIPRGDIFLDLEFLVAKRDLNHGASF